MLNVSLDEIEVRLKNEGYNNDEIEQVLKSLEELSTDLIPVFDAWWKNTTYPQTDVEGYTFSGLIKTYKMHPIAALLTLDWLYKDPFNAKKAVEYGIK